MMSYTLVIYTDGINEAMNADRELYGVNRVRHTLQAGPAPLKELCEYLLDDVRNYTHDRTQSDDVCLVAFQRK